MKEKTSLVKKGNDALKSVWKNPAGRVRAVWKFLLACAVYAVWTFLAGRGLSAGLQALFSAWNLNAQTVALAPKWAQAFAGISGSFISFLTGAGVIALCAVLVRLFERGEDRPAFRIAAFFRYALFGALAVAAGAGLFLLTDSMRSRGGASFSWELPILAVVFLTAALAEEMFLHRLLLETVRKETRVVWACIASAAVFFVTTGSYALSALGMANMAVLGLLAACLYIRRGFGCAAGFRFGWSLLSTAVFGFPASNVASCPLVSLYAVSDGWLTGGEGGMVCGLWTSLILVLLAAWLFRKELASALKKLSGRKGRQERKMQ